MKAKREDEPRKQDWRPHEGRIPGLQLPYIEAGEGEPVLFLHGWAGFKEIWWGTLRAVAPRFRGIALDWPGHAGCPPAEGAHTLHDLVELAARSCRALCLPPVTTVGHSMGARVAALLALRYPERVARLVLVAPALTPGHLRIRRPPLGDKADVERALALHRSLERGVGRIIRPAPHDHRGGLVKPFLRRMREAARADAGALHRYAAELYRETKGVRLDRIGQPTLVIMGGLDPLVRPREARRSAGAIPRARFHLIPRAFHTPMDDRPQEFRQVLLDFLESAPRAGADGR